MIDIIARAMAAAAAKGGGGGGGEETPEVKLDLLKELGKESLEDVTDDDITYSVLTKMSKVSSLYIDGRNYFLYHNDGQSFVAINLEDDYKAHVLYGTAGSFNKKEMEYANSGELEAITELIPNQASVSNQLADKAFVNSSVQTATANFRGNYPTWADVPAEASAYPVDFAGKTTPTVNDYLVIEEAKDYHGEEVFTTVGSVSDHYIDENGQFVAGSGFSYTQKLPVPHENDKKIVFMGESNAKGNYRIHAFKEDDTWIEEITSGNLNEQIHSLRLSGNIPIETSYFRVSYITESTILSLFVCEEEGTWRFKYTGNWEELGKEGWKPEYQVNETPLTSEQLAALNSGVTAEILDKKMNKAEAEETYAKQEGNYPNLMAGGILGIKFGKFDSVAAYEEARQAGALEAGVTYIVKRGE